MPLPRLTARFLRDDSGTLRLFTSGLLGLLALALPTRAQDADTLRPAAAADTTAPRAVYATERTTAEQSLAFPANVLHWITRPVGDVVIWAERKDVPTRVRNVFWNDAGTFGIFPVAQIGGPALGAAGLAVRHERLFGTPRRAEARFLYANPENVRASARYQHPAPFGEETFVDLGLRFRTDADENLFLSPVLGSAGGETSYRIRQFDARLGLGADPRAPVGLETGFGRLGWGVFGRYEHTRIGRGEGDGADRFPTGLPGVGTAQLLTAGASLLLDHTRGRRVGQPRTVAGSRLFAAYDFTSDLGPEPFSYHRLAGEGQLFVPLAFLGPYRRLAFRAHLEKLFPTPGEAVPFYQLALLGNADALRGFEQNRFRDEGSLLFTLEYHYPIWTSWDALLFVDGGQTFDTFADVAPADFRWSGGFGFRIYAGAGVSLRLDVGFSEDGARTFAQGGSNFVTSTRR